MAHGLTVMAFIILPPFKFQCFAYHTWHISLVPKGEHWQLLRPHSVRSRWMSVEHWWNDTNRGKPKYPEKNQSFCYFIHFESGLGMNPSLRGERVVTNHLFLQYDRASFIKSLDWLTGDFTSHSLIISLCKCTHILLVNCSSCTDFQPM